MESISIFWFRRDLRLEDNAGLYHALKSGNRVLPLFIFDTDILDKLENRADPRVEFIHNCIFEINTELKALGSGVICKLGKPLDIFIELAATYSIDTVYTNTDYEPYAIGRDEQVSEFLNTKAIKFKSFKDHVIFEKNEVVKDDGKPYTVFTPYSRKCLSILNSKIDVSGIESSFYLKSYSTKQYFNNFYHLPNSAILTLETIGFLKSGIVIPPAVVSSNLIKDYNITRDFPGKQGTSKLGIHFRFGTISIRDKARKALSLNRTFLSELIWRDFYAQILWHFPKVEKHAFRAEYDNIEWINDESDFDCWCNGLTGYPLVDAGMRELKETGYMHNRVRMVVASFLTKHLLIDWRWGEAYFATKLLDYDLASNNGGWQWAAGCGTDAAPYFRIFNPTSQMNKFDKELVYIKKWIPEYGSDSYPDPIVDHDFARKRCLEVYKRALNKS